MAKYQTNRRRLLKEVVCPHCWTAFQPENILWISEDPSLVGDDRLGESERTRFLPTEYDEFGAALDATGKACRDMACPRCHLKIPAPALDSPPVFMSIVGAPACGKSYYLASSTWTLRRVMPSKFGVNFTDADPAMNHRLHEYEARQFLYDGSGLVRIEKTEEQGDSYDAVRIGEQSILLPQPFTFLAKSSKDNADVNYSRMVCLYDNAGESFLPTNDQTSTPVTRHLEKSRCVFFVFDPTQDAGFRRELMRRFGEASSRVAAASGAVRPALRQEVIFSETTRRLRALRHMTTYERFEDLLVVVVSKADVWAPLSSKLTALLAKEPTARTSGSTLHALRSDKIESANAELRKLLEVHTPEFVSAVDSFATPKNVVFVPVSATGVAPKVDARTRTSGFRVEDMKPVWIAAPMLYALHRLAPDLIPAGRMKDESDEGAES